MALGYCFDTNNHKAFSRSCLVLHEIFGLGLMLGSLFRGQSLDRRKAKLFLFIVTGFILGGTSGALLYAEYAFKALFVPAILCLILAAAYRVYAKRLKLKRQST